MIDSTTYPVDISDESILGTNVHAHTYVEYAFDIH